MDDLFAECCHGVEHCTKALLEISEADSERRPPPGKWSQKKSSAT